MTSPAARQQLNLRLPAADLDRFRAEAARRRLPLATWLRMVAHEECDRAVATVSERQTPDSLLSSVRPARP